MVSRRVRRFSITSEARYVIARERRWINYLVSFLVVVTLTTLGVVYRDEGMTFALIVVLGMPLGVLFIATFKPTHFELSVDKDEEEWQAGFKIFAMIPYKTRIWDLANHELHLAYVSVDEERPATDATGCVSFVLPFPLGLIVSAFSQDKAPEIHTNDVYQLQLREHGGGGRVSSIVDVVVPAHAERVMRAFNELVPESVGFDPEDVPFDLQDS